MRFISLHTGSRGRRYDLRVYTSSSPISWLFTILLFLDAWDEYWLHFTTYAFVISILNTYIAFSFTLRCRYRLVTRTIASSHSVKYIFTYWFDFILHLPHIHAASSRHTSIIISYLFTLVLSSIIGTCFLIVTYDSLHRHVDLHCISNAFAISTSFLLLDTRFITHIWFQCAA